MIYTFYSFKGGVGRSMALANIAELLYQRGLKVLMVDFDLEAPGLERYFDLSDADKASEIYDSVINTPDEVETKRGLMDLLVSYKNLRSMLRPDVLGVPDENAEATLAPDDDDSPPDKSDTVSAPATFSFPVEPLSNFIYQIYKKNKKGGELYMIPAGRRAKTAYGNDGDKENNQREFARYAERVRAFPWNDFYIKWDGQMFFDWFRAEAEKFADIVLIDSRTGVTEMSGICTYHLADVVVMFTATNKQNIAGTKKIADSLRSEKLESEGRKGRKLSLLIIPSRVEINEKVELDTFAKDFKEVFDPLLPSGLLFRETDSFSDLTIRYVPYYSFREEVAVRDKGSPVASVLVKVYEELCLIFAKLEPETGSKLRGEYPLEQLHEGNVAEQQNRVAQAAFAQLMPADQAMARSILIRLVRVAQSGEAGGDSCLRLSVKEFNGPSLKTLRALSNTGLVVIEEDGAGGDEVAQLAQEGFIQHWTRLREWLDKDRSFLIWRQNLKINIEQWNHSKREKAALLSGKSLSEAKQWRESYGDELSDTENLFIVESSRRESKIFIEKVVFVALAVILVAALTGYTFWERAAQNKEKQQKEKEQIEALRFTYNESGKESSKNNDFKSAIDFYTKAINLQPHDAEGFNRRGEAYYASGQVDPALADFNQALRLKPDYAEALLNRGMVDIARNEFDQALNSLNQAVAIKPDKAEAYYYRGNVFSQKSEYESALRDYGRALLLKHDNYPEVYFQRGLVYKALYQKDKTANADAKENAASDFATAANSTDIPGLRTEAMIHLEELVGKQASTNDLPSAQPPLVFIHYNNPDDQSSVAKIGEDIQTARIILQGSQTSDNYTDGDVRYYYPEDKKNAFKVRDVVTSSLRAQGLERAIKVRFLGNYYKNVRRGSIEVWLPALDTREEVDQPLQVEPPPLKAQPTGRVSIRRRA